MNRIQSRPPQPVRVFHSQPNTQLFLSPTQSEGLGELVVADNELFWWNANTAGGIAIPYPALVIHAISTDKSSFPLPAIYCQLDTGNDMPADPDQETAASSELWFAPEDAASLTAIFEALSEGQALHPDPDSIDQEDSDFYFDEEQAAENAARLAHLESAFQMPAPGEFDEMVNDDGANGGYAEYAHDDEDSEQHAGANGDAEHDADATDDTYAAPQ